MGNISGLAPSLAQSHLSLFGRIEWDLLASPQPLLDMCTYSEDPAVHAEVACALAAMAQDADFALQLCTEHAFAVIRMLLRSNSSAIAIAMPTARLLSGLALLPE